MKSTRSHKVPNSARLAAFDQALNCVQKINTLADLLETCDVGFVSQESVNGTGILITEQVHRLRGELNKLR